MLRCREPQGSDLTNGKIKPRSSPGLSANKNCKMGNKLLFAPQPKNPKETPRLNYSKSRWPRLLHWLQCHDAKGKTSVHALLHLGHSLARNHKFPHSHAYPQGYSPCGNSDSQSPQLCV